MDLQTASQLLGTLGMLSALCVHFGIVWACYAYMHLDDHVIQQQLFYAEICAYADELVAMSDKARRVAQ